MKKILILISIILIFWLNFTWITYAEDCAEVDGWIKVTVTEKIPWACCWVWTNTWTYDCTIEPGFWTVTKMMWSLIKYFTFIASLGGVLFIVFNGIMYSMGWIEQTLKDNAKKRIVQTLIWLTVLLLSWVILNLVAPWIYVG